MIYSFPAEIYSLFYHFILIHLGKKRRPAQSLPEHENAIEAGMGMMAWLGATVAP